MPLEIQDTSYAGEAASGFKVRAITGADTINRGLAYLQDGIKKKYTIPLYDSEETVQDRVATPSSPSGSSMVVSARTLTPADYMLYDEFRPADFEQHWLAREMNPELLDALLPATAEATILGQVMKMHAKFIERILWQGDTTTTGKLKYFDGWIKKMLAATTVNKVTSSLAVLTDSNVVDKMQATYSLIPEALLFDPNVKVAVSYKTAEHYRNWQQAQPNKGVDKTSGGVMTFNGKRVEPLAGVPNDTIVIGRFTADMDSNLWIGMNSTDDQDYIQMARLQANSELFFYKILMKLDVNFGFGEELCLYHLDN